jgi:hypothetical protein
MPFVRYFLFTGGILLALLFWADWFFPKPLTATAAGDIDRTVIRIHSGHVWPAAVQFDTGAPMPHVEPRAMAEADSPAPAKSLKQAYAYEPPPAARAPDKVRRQSRTASRLPARKTQQRLASSQTSWFSATW